MRTPQDLPRRLPRTTRRFRIGVGLAVLVVIILIASLRTLATFWTDYLWFREVHFTSVFRGVLVNEVILAVVFTVAFFLLMFVNLTIADRVAPALASGPEDELVVRYRQVVAPRARLVRIVVSVIFALLAGIGTRGEWNNWVLFLHKTSFGKSDPLNHIDYGFYVFQLPFIKFVIGWLIAAIVVVTMVTAVAHYLNGGINFQATGERVTRQVKTHISVLFAALALIKAGDYYLERIELVLSRKYVVDGATYTVVHAQRPADIILIVAALFAVGLFVYNIRQRGWLLPGVAIGVWIVVYLLVGVAYPAFIEAVRVHPSEITREQPYITDNIKATQSAFALTNVTQSNQTISNVPVNASQVTGSSPAEVANQEALDNVRLLDPAFVANAFNKDQELRGYFAFNDLDIDRYEISGQLTETLLAVRELNESGVPSGFVNQELEYTHGYGAAVAPATEAGVNADGTINYALSGLPPASKTPALSLTGPGSQPRVYYGEGSATSGYVIADSKQPELDYENEGQAQVTSTYMGTGGVRAGSLVRRAAFALRFGAPSLLLSGQITSNSKVMYFRNVTQRVQKAAPFLSFDNDPYAVILSGRIYWILDGYTTTNNYPYSQEADTSRLGGGSSTLAGKNFNYVRNSVKVVVDAYNGSMKFFVVDPTDPVIQTYEKAFPDLFTNESQADKIFPGITSHWRYPEDLFTVQTNMYGRYHLSNAHDFYTQAQAWVIAQDPGSGTPGQQTAIGTSQLTATGQLVTASAPRFTPTYLITHLPGSTTQQFLILEPFVPMSQGDKQQNLTGFMTAESSATGQGSLQLFQTPPGSNVDGPLLAAAAINANQTISKEISLLNQQGSKVVLGNLVTVPLDQTLMYVEPLYVESATNSVPQLDDVIVIYNGTAYDSGNASLDAALCQITNPDGSQPFITYCNTAAARRTSAGGGSATTPGGSTSTTSTTSPSTSTSTSVPTGSAATTLPPPQGSTVAQLLANAQAAFTRGQGGAGCRQPGALSERDQPGQRRHRTRRAAGQPAAGHHDHDDTAGVHVDDHQGLDDHQELNGPSGGGGDGDGRGYPDAERRPGRRRRGARGARTTCHP